MSLEIRGGGAPLEVVDYYQNHGMYSGVEVLCSLEQNKIEMYDLQ